MRRIFTRELLEKKGYQVRMMSAYRRSKDGRVIALYQAVARDMYEFDKLVHVRREVREFPVMKGLEANWSNERQEIILGEKQ